MSVADLIGFLVLTGAAAYAQTLTGFAFGLITMGGVGLTGLLSLPDAAMIVSVLTLVNATQMLLKGWRDVAWREFSFVMTASIPLLFVGYWLLEWLAGTQADVLRLILGCVIIVSSLQLARKPEPLAKRSKDGSFLFLRRHCGPDGGNVLNGGPAAGLSFLPPTDAARDGAGNARHCLRAQCRVPDRPRGALRQSAVRLHATGPPRHPRRHGRDLCGAPLATACIADHDAPHRIHSPFSVRRVARSACRHSPSRSLKMTVHAKPVERCVLALKTPSLLVGQAYVAGAWIDAPNGKTSRASSNSNTFASPGCKALNRIMKEERMADFVLALDQGTTSSRAIVFDGTYRIRGLAQREFPQIYPKPGWVEHDPQDLWHTIVETMRSALADAGLAASDIAAIGITNQRETVVSGTA